MNETEEDDMSNCKELISNNQKRYLVALCYVELGEQNGAMVEETLFALNPHHALAQAILKHNSEQNNMLLAGWDVYHCERVLT